MTRQTAAEAPPSGGLASTLPGGSTTEDEFGDEQQAAEVELPVWHPTLGERIAEAWRGRYLLWPIAMRIVPTYHGRILGRGWIVLRPFMQVFGFALIIGGVFKQTGPNGVPYLVFVIFSMQAFRLFEQTVIYETLSSRMVKKVTRNMRVPLLLVPIGATVRGMLEVAIYWLFAAAALIYYYFAKGHLYLQVSPRLLAGIGALVLLLLYALALGFFCCAFYNRARDLRYVVRYVMQFWFFLTPVVYSAKQIPHWAQTAAQINPLGPLLGLAQYGFLNAGKVQPYGLLWSAAVILLTGAFGLWFFNRFATDYIGVFQLSVGEEDDGGDDMF